MMRKVIFLILVISVNFNISNIAQAQNLTDYAKQKQREIAGKKQKERSMYESACQEGTLKAFNQYLSIYPKGHYVQDVRNRITELERRAEQVFYDSICRLETLQAYKDYIDKYPNGRYVDVAKKHITEIQLWNDANRIASKDAYERYISQSPFKTHFQEAEEQITILSADDDWTHCDTSSKTELERYLARHPQSRYTDRAKYHLNILKALETYQKGDKLAAFSYLDEAKKTSPLFDDALRIYNQLYEEYTSPKMLVNNDADEIIQYLKNLSPSSIYYNRISNHLAILLSSNFNASTTSIDIERALGYAKDETTRDVVLTNARIRSNKDSNRIIRKNESSSSSWLKGRVHVGIRLGVEKNTFESCLYFDGGLVLRFGKHTDLFNLLVGADFRLYTFYEFPTNPELLVNQSYINGGEILIPITAQFNILKISNSWSFYVGGGCDIHARVYDNFQFLRSSSVSFVPQLGFTSRHWDLGAHLRVFPSSPYFIYSTSSTFGIHGIFYF